MPGIKINIRLNIMFLKQTEKVNFGFFKSNAREIINENDIELIIRISEWISKGCGWVIKSVDKHEIDMSIYKIFIATITIKINKNATINIQNENDNECFRWCHLAFLFPVKQNAERIQNIKNI